MEGDEASSEHDWRRVLTRCMVVARALLRNWHDREEALQNACVRYSRAVADGIAVRDRAAFVMHALFEEACSVRRARLRRSAREVGASDAQPRFCGDAIQTASIETSFHCSEHEIELVRLMLPPLYQKWLEDRLSDQRDAELAAREQVTPTAIRLRWSRLRAAMHAILGSQDFFHFPGYKVVPAAPSAMSRTRRSSATYPESDL